MTLQSSCHHGHKLQLPDDPSSDLLCPLCGSDVIRKDGVNIKDPSAFAVTVIPVSEVGRRSSGLLKGLLGSDGDSSESGSSGSGTDSSDVESSEDFAPTTDFVPTDSGVPEEKSDEIVATEPAAAKRKKKKREKDYRPPSVTGIELMDELGRGGMGVVYRAYDEKHGRDVALKTLQRMGPDDLVRFKQEFRALADIAHPNLASLYELHSDGKTWCFTMELLNGVEFLEYVWSEFESLNVNSGRQRVAEVVHDSTRLSIRRINRLYDALKQLAVGLNELHQAGKLHSDIKPSNVFVTTEGRLVLLDFVLIAEISRDEDGRVPRLIQGTPHYMAPEQAACGTLTEASDWYAVGVMLYEVLTGRLPFRDKSVQTMLRKQYEMPVAPKKRKPGVPDELNDLCMALLEIDPAKRPTTIDVLRAVEADDIADRLVEQKVTTSSYYAELVGREAHFDILRQSLAEVADGQTRSVFVHGRSGMGKSVLIRSFLDGISTSGTGISDETIVLEGRCYEQESVPFKALDSLIDALVIYLGRLPTTEIAELLPEDSLPLTQLFPVFAQVSGASDENKPSIESADQLELRQRAMTAMRQLLTRLGERRPVVLYIDDLQWGDEDSANLIADLVRPPKSPRLLLLGSYRREDIETSSALLTLADAYEKGQVQPHRRELPVDPLSEEDAAHLAASLLGRTDRAASQLAERIAKESNGSPFFVWELAQHVRDDSTGSAGSLELDEVIWSRVCRLPEETRRLLEVFAVAGRPMRASEAYQTIDERTHGPGLLAQLRTSNFVRTTEQQNDTLVETYHDRIRESVVNHLAAAKVRGHHLKIALVIEQTGGFSLADIESHIRKTPDFSEPEAPLSLDRQDWQRVFDLAFFFDAAGKPERALPYALVAAERATSQNALDVAEQQFEIARRGAGVSAAGDALRFRIAEGFGDVLVMRAKYEPAGPHFQAARRLATDNLTLARIDGKRGFLCFKSGDMPGSARHLEAALKELGAPPPGNIVFQTFAVMRDVLVQLLHTLLPSTFTQRRNPDTEAGRLDLFRARLYDLLSYPYWWIKGPVPNLWTHLRHMNLSEKYPPSQVMGRAFSFHAIIMQAVPLPGRGIAYAERSYRIHDNEADLVGKGKARSYQTFAYFTAGRFKEGVESGREAVRLLEEAGDVWEANMARIILSFPLYLQGDHESAAVEARKAVEIGQETGDKSSVVIALWFWAIYAARQVPEGLIISELDQPSRDPLSDVAIILARGQELLLREDNPREAAEYFQRGLVVARKRGLRNPCVFCAMTWKTKALRIVAERESEGPTRTAALKQARKAARYALLTTRMYLTSRPEALREKALICALDGKEARARRYFDESLRLAQEQEASYEIARTELARGEAGLKFGWPVDNEQMAAAEQEVARIRKFTETTDD